VPPGDREDFDRAYRRIVRNLQEEFGSLTFTEEMEIRSLAHDYFVSDLGRQMVATLLRPNQLSNEDADLWKELRKHDRDFSRVKRAIANYKSGRPWCPTLVRATPLADRLLWFLANAENTLREDQNPDVDPLTQVEIELRAPMTKMLDILGPTRRKLADCDYLVNALMNPTKLTKLQSRRIEALVDYAFTMLLRRPPDNYATLPSKVRMQSDQMLAKSALNPSRLVVLQQYLGRLDRSIRRKLAALRRRR
jgi:hypothetical protein